MVDDFGPHAERHGGRLRQIQSLGRRGGVRFVDAEEGAEAGSVGATRRLHADPGLLELAEFGREVKRLEAAEELVRGTPGTMKLAPVVEPRGRGRPKFEGVRPWEALGISRAEYFRRRKAGK